MDNPGKLYIVATPIGNMGDFSPRATETLEAVDFIAAEDTRVTSKLLARVGVQKPLISYFEHNRRQKGELIAGRLLAGQSCALITDAGTPAISDPGTDLVALCAQSGVEVVAVPGCCAAVAALSVSGMECGRFTFEGFLSANGKKRREHLTSLKSETRTMVFYEAPHKLLRTLEDMLEHLGNRQLAVCREITKLHEETLRLTISQALAHFTVTPPRGEFVLVIAGAAAQEADASAPDYVSMVEALVKQGESLMDAAKQISRQYNVPKNSLYRQALANMKDKSFE